jgi:hypothetical protein
LRPEDIAEKKPEQALEVINRHYGRPINFMKENGYKTGFNGVSLDKALELLGICANEPEADEEVKENLDKVTDGFVNSYLDGYLSDYETVYSELKNMLSGTCCDLYDIIYKVLSSTGDKIEDIVEECRNLIKDVDPDTVHIANELNLFLSAYHITEGKPIEGAVSNFRKRVHMTRPRYYRDDLEEALSDLEFSQSEAKARHCRHALTVQETGINAEKIFCFLCFFRAQSKIERERHNELNSPRILHLEISDILLEAVYRVNADIPSVEKYKSVYKKQVKAELFNMESEHRKSGILYFKASMEASEFHKGREIKLAAQGWREVAKVYSYYEKRKKLYCNALFYFDELKESGDEKQLLERIMREFRIEKRICDVKQKRREFIKIKRELQKEVGNARSLIQGDEKFMNENPSYLDEVLDEL